ncbi:MAG: class C sortase [Ruminococcus sp.]
MRIKRFSLSTLILVIIMLVGLSVMLYPSVSDWWNSRVQSYAIASYDAAVEQIDDNHYDEILNAAHQYNQALLQAGNPIYNPDCVPGYNETLNISGTGIMGYITIPDIRVQLPIYHGTSEEVLNVAAGHLHGTSLPVGGEGTHCVISAHRGLPSARLFSDLDQLCTGDTFTITILDEILTYEVEEINIVLPNEVNKIAPVPGKDYVTLMTCTPYGVNSHRLLVRAHRIETVYPHNIKISADAVQVDPMLVVPVLCTPLILVLVLYWIISSKTRRKPSVKNIYSDLNSQNEESE